MSTPTAATTSRRSVARWTIAAAATGALVISGSGLVAFAQSGAAESQGPVFVPADAALYVEARLDMPGGQADALAQMMTAFPGFADTGSFDLKVDELMSGLTAELGVTMPEGDLVGDVLTGEIGLAVADLERAMTGGTPAVLLGMAVADAAAAGTVMDALIAGSEAPLTESTYNDVTIYTDSGSDTPMSVAMHGDWVVVGTGEEQVQASIDVLDGSAPSLAQDAAFTAAWDGLPDARLGAAWMNFAPMAGLLDMAMMLAEGETGMALPSEDLAAIMPIDMVASLSAESDRLHLEVAMTPGEGMPEFSAGESELSLSFPEDTQVYLETRDLGANIQSALGQVETMLGDMPTDESTGMSELGVLFSEESPLTAMLGVPLPELLDFVGDASVGAGLSSDGLWLGMAAEVIDGDSAQERYTSLMTILRLAMASSEDDGMSVDTADVGGVEVTTITLPIDQMMAESGLPLTVGDSISVALTDDHLLMGLGDFVQNALVADATSSLGSSAGFIDALGDDTVNTGVMYVDISSMLAALDPMLAMMGSEWEQISPYAGGLDRMVVVGTADEGTLGARMTVIAGQ